MARVTAYGDLAIGDVVKILSGGPDLTVQDIIVPDTPPAPAGTVALPVQPMVTCIWFTEAGAISKYDFPYSVLDAGGDKPAAKKNAPAGAPTPAAPVA